MDHDPLFKEIIGTFFLELLDAFLPSIAQHVDRDSEIVRLDKEIITDITRRKKHIVDLALRAKVKGQDASFVFHVENQARLEADYPLRMFIYFSRLVQRYNMPVYPIVIFSHDSPHRAEPSQYKMAFPDLNVMTFNYRVIQLNRMSWRRYLKNDNPAICALMAKMNIAPKDRPRVKLECLRMLVRLQIDPARAKVIAVFVDSYLQLNPLETGKYEKELATLTEDEQEATMEYLTSWEKKGIAQGRQEGVESLLTRQLRRRLGELPTAAKTKIDQLSLDEMEDLGEALLDFTSQADLDRWLSVH